jgi:hypothetical protein
LRRLRKLQVSNAEIEVLEGPNYGPFSTPNLPGFSNRLVRSWAKADYDFKQDAAAKLEAFITSKNSCPKHLNNFDHLDELKEIAWLTGCENFGEATSVPLLAAATLLNSRIAKLPE